LKWREKKVKGRIKKVWTIIKNPKILEGVLTKEEISDLFIKVWLNPMLAKSFLITLIILVG